MNWHQVCLSECTPQPWRNGGGLTHEMAAWPDAINWIWRVSVARIERNGAFSSFDGVQRWFAVLTGQGVELIWPTYRKVLTPQTPPLQFAGTPACHAHLIAGPTLDFNLMTRGKHALLTSQSEKVDHGTWPANAFVGVFAHDDCEWTRDGHRVIQQGQSLHWSSLRISTSWSWLNGKGFIFVIPMEDQT